MVKLWGQDEHMIAMNCVTQIKHMVYNELCVQDKYMLWTSSGFRVKHIAWIDCVFVLKHKANMITYLCRTQGMNKLYVQVEHMMSIDWVF